MRNSEKVSSFNERRDQFKNYGFTCEVWEPGLMGRPDRHNEIEINYIPNGSLTYLFKDKIISIPEKTIAVFWGLIPHQIIEFSGKHHYYVCTIPVAQFLEWKIEHNFVNKVLNGMMFVEKTNEVMKVDDFLFKSWVRDINDENLSEIVKLEIRARLSRIALTTSAQNLETKTITANEISPVERIAVYIAQNYNTHIKTSEIGAFVGLHPDYANAIFKKTFGRTLSDYIIHERIAHTQRKLLTCNDSIADIAFESGFNSLSSFNAAFLKINRCTPRQFRKVNQINIKGQEDQ